MSASNAGTPIAASMVARQVTRFFSSARVAG